MRGNRPRGRRDGAGGARTVGEVAALSGISVRTLHHYDEIGLLHPSDRSSAGYRRYTEVDLDRLARILAYRELGFTLEQIRDLLDDPTVEPVEHLRRQHALMSAQLARMQRIVLALTKAMEAREMGIKLDPHEMVGVFGEHDPTEHAAEAEARWGETDAYRESTRRTSSFTKAGWLRIKEEAAGIDAAYVDALRSGEPANERVGRAAAEAHRMHIDTWFYPCGRQVHCGLAEMYLADPRFTARYERLAPGLAQYVHDAILANAATA